MFYASSGSAKTDHLSSTTLRALRVEPHLLNGDALIKSDLPSDISLWDNYQAGN
jgi:hypothetical protein